MRRPILTAVLVLGVIGGFGSGFARLARAHHGGSHCQSRYAKVNPLQEARNDASAARRSAQAAEQTAQQALTEVRQALAEAKQAQATVVPVPGAFDAHAQAQLNAQALELAQAQIKALTQALAQQQAKALTTQ